MLRTNADHLVEFAVMAPIHHPTGWESYKIDPNGVPHVLPGVGGIVYNYQIGDNCMDLVGDHVEPGVSLQAKDRKENDAVCMMACIGNKAVVVDGDAKGATGFVTGMHGGIDHTMVYFPKDDLIKMKIGDQVQIRVHGMGLKLLDFPEIICQSLSPALLEKLQPKQVDHALEVPCAAIVPGFLMGSGIGSLSGHTGDYDIMTGDKALLKEHGLDKLRFGDLVFLDNCDNRYGRQYLQGAGSLGVIVHSNCILAGHGPGVTTLLTAKDGRLIPRLDPKANLAEYFLEGQA